MLSFARLIAYFAVEKREGTQETAVLQSYENILFRRVCILLLYCLSSQGKVKAVRASNFLFSRSIKPNSKQIKILQKSFTD